MSVSREEVLRIAQLALQAVVRDQQCLA